MADKSHFQVLEYLSKKGYSKSEATLRMESSMDGGHISTKVDEPIGAKYLKTFGARSSAVKVEVRTDIGISRRNSALY